jgi:uncharacterized membrane protein YjgN (DUF898 family)
MRRHLWSNTVIDGDAAEYTGRGKELLIGFLFALAILAPVYIAYFLVGIEAERYKAFASFPLFLFFYVFGQFAIYRARRYRLTRTVWRGVRFWMDGSGWAYAWRATLWALLVVLTLGLALPWREAALERYKMRHCHYGDLPGRFEGRGSEFFKRGWRFWVIAMLPIFAIYIVQFSRFVPGLPPGANGLPPGASVIAPFAFLFWLVSAPFIYGAFKVVEWRWWISGIRFGEVSFESDLSSGALIGLYWKIIGWFLFITVLLVVSLLTCAWLIAGGDLAHHVAQLQASTSMQVAGVIGYFAYILALNIVIRVYLLRDVWTRVVSSIAAYHLESVADVAVSGDLASALGEGLSGDLDVVGF